MSNSSRWRHFSHNFTTSDGGRRFPRQYINSTRQLEVQPLKSRYFAACVNHPNMHSREGSQCQKRSRWSKKLLPPQCGGDFIYPRAWAKWNEGILGFAILTLCRKGPAWFELWYCSSVHAPVNISWKHFQNPGVSVVGSFEVHTFNCIYTVYIQSWT